MGFMYLNCLLFVFNHTLPLTCSGDAVKPYKGVKTGGGTGEDSGETKWHEAAGTKIFL